MFDSHRPFLSQQHYEFSRYMNILIDLLLHFTSLGKGIFVVVVLLLLMGNNHCLFKRLFAEIFIMSLFRL